MRCELDRDFQTLPELLRFRAELHPNRQAALFLHDDGSETQCTYGDLWRQSVAVARSLAEITPANGNVRAKTDQPHASTHDAPRAMLLFPPGLDFLPAFLGAQLAGWIPVPTCHPKPHRKMPRVDSVVRDCSPSAILSTSSTIKSIDGRKLDPGATALPMIAVDAVKDNRRLGDSPFDLKVLVTAESVALLQYTSGSTSEPKGVVVTQQNVMANIAAIFKCFQLDLDQTSSNEAVTAASWLPFFHDMGLIGGVLAPLYAGFRSVFISPTTFVQRPIRWLQIISEYRAIVSGAPNFAYELCADRIAPSQAAELDLSSLKVAFCGAEPIRPQTLHTFAQRFSSIGFRDTAYFPCYGLAEATLMAAGGAGPGVPKVLEVDKVSLRESRIELSLGRSKRDTTSLVACGAAVSGTTLKIVDPQTSLEVAENGIGEIWLQGDSITSGYWNCDEENQNRLGHLKTPARSGVASKWFRKSVAAVNGSQNADARPYLRSGDLGFVHQGNLYVTGRSKDIVIVRGRNYAPQDLEATIVSLAIHSQGRAAAVSVQGPRAEGLAMIVEIARDTAKSQYQEIVRSIRRAIIEEHEIDPRIVCLVKPATIPVTTSGKLQRSVCRELLAAESAGQLYRWERNGGAESPPIPIPELPAAPSPADRLAIEAVVRQWLITWLVTRVGIDPSEIDVDRCFDDYGLDSLTTVELSGELEDWSGVELPPANAWEHPTVNAMAMLVSRELVEARSENDTELYDASSVDVDVLSAAAK